MYLFLNEVVIMIAQKQVLTLFILDTGDLGTLANSEDPDEMLHKAAFHQGLHCLLELR